MERQPLKQPWKAILAEANVAKPATNEQPKAPTTADIRLRLGIDAKK